MKAIHELSEQHHRFGYRQIWALLRQDGWKVNVKRIHRLWKEAGLQVPKKKVRKRRRLGSSENGCVRLKPAYPGHMWSYDFIYDRTETGAQLKIMPVIDEFTRRCFVVDVSRSIKATDVIAQLEQLFERHGIPDNIRSDNAPEFIADALKAYLADESVQTRFVEPGAPWENGYIESFNSRFRDELLDRELFATTLEAQVLCEQWRRFYNEERPHSGLDYQTPAAYTANYEAPQPSNPVQILS